MAVKQHIIRTCNMILAPLNQLQKMAHKGYCIQVFKQAISNEIPHLTEREQECLQYLIDGINAQTIALKMHISETRAWELLRALRKKFGVSTDHHVVARYYQLGMDYHA